MEIIIIRGSAGVGKTTIAKELAKALNAEYFSFDVIMKENKLDTIIGDGIPAENFVKANEIIMSLIKSKNKVVLDGCFYRKKQVDHLLNKFKDKIHIFTLDADINECLKRNKTRNNPMQENSIRQVYQLVSNLQLGIKINTDGKTIQEIVSEILNHLSE